MIEKLRTTTFLLLAAAGSALAADLQFRDLVTLEDLDASTDQGRLGRAVAVNDGFVFAGAPDKDGLAGAVYVLRFEGGGLSVLRELTPTGNNPDGYGRAISSDGEWTAIGYDFGGPIELYRRVGDDWVFFKGLEAPDLGPDVSVERFGNDLDLRGDRLIVGDDRADGAQSNIGVAMVFARNAGGPDNWGLEDFMLAPPGPEGTYGSAVAIDGATAIVADGGAEKVHVFRRTGTDWAFLKTLEPLGQQPDDAFGECANDWNGRCIDIEGDLIAVAALTGNDAVAPTNSGSVHLFRRAQGGADGYGQVAQLVPSQPGFIDEFGVSLQLRDGLLFVGASGNGSNKAYLFADTGSGFAEQAFVEPDPALDFGNPEFGTAVGYDKGQLVVGSGDWDDVASGDRFGALFGYELPAVVTCGTIDGIFCDGFED